MTAEERTRLVARKCLQAIHDVLEEFGEPWVVPGSRALTPGTRRAVEALLEDLRVPFGGVNA